MWSPLCCAIRTAILHKFQLDFEDEEPEEEDESQSEEEDNSKSDESGSEGDNFEDAMEKLDISGRDVATVVAA